jgi:ArsR family transcriptional regulator
MKPEHLFSILSDKTRLRTLMLIEAEGELCVCELTAALNIPQPKVSRHLALMRDAGLVEARRDGKWMHYRIRPDIEGWGLQIISRAVSSLAPLERFRADRTALRGLDNRPGDGNCD